MVLMSSNVLAFNFGTDYTETIQNNGLGADGFDYVSTITFNDGHGFIGLGETETWYHSLSSDYMPVPDQYVVTSATLQITGTRYIGFGYDLVTFAGEMQWTSGGGWRWIGTSDNTFDLTNIDYGYWNSDPFAVSFTPVLDLGVNISSSVLSVDYAEAGGSGDNYADASAVPEPASLLLIALGLGGLAGMRKLRNRAA